MTRKVWIDTDTASDDVLAIIMGLRDSRVQVQGISVVAGNLPIDLAESISFATADGGRRSQQLVMYGRFRTTDQIRWQLAPL